MESRIFESKAGEERYAERLNEEYGRSLHSNMNSITPQHAVLRDQADTGYEACTKSDIGFIH